MGVVGWRQWQNTQFFLNKRKSQRRLPPCIEMNRYYCNSITNVSNEIPFDLVSHPPNECLRGAVEDVPEGERAPAGPSEAAGVADEDELRVEVERGRRGRELEPRLVRLLISVCGVSQK